MMKLMKFHFQFGFAKIKKWKKCRRIGAEVFLQSMGTKCNKIKRLYTQEMYAV